MPGMNGNDLCRRLKEGTARGIPVIILTANDADVQRVRGLRAGADDYVSKSASLDELAARIESIVRRTGETDRVRRLFARYTSDAVVDEILNSSSELVLTGEKREVTVLFADLRNFTGISESLPPEAVVAMLNEVLGPPLRRGALARRHARQVPRRRADGGLRRAGAPPRRRPAGALRRAGDDGVRPGVEPEEAARGEEPPRARARASASTPGPRWPGTSAPRCAPSTPASATA